MFRRVCDSMLKDCSTPEVEDQAIEASGLFDAAWYVERHGLAVDIDPLQHYRSIGWREGCDPSRAFSVAGYLEAYPEVRTGGQDPLADYLLRGREEGRKPVSVDTQALRASDLFDAAWYADRNGLDDGIDALDHYRSKGWREGRDPSPRFSAQGYLEAYADVKAAGAEPLEHYLLHGRQEGRQVHHHPDRALLMASGLFDEVWYRHNNTVPSGLDALEHYRTVGWKEGRDPGPFFHLKSYLEEHADIRNAGIEPLRHFHRFGREEGRRIGRPMGDGVGKGPWLDMVCTDPKNIGSIIVVVHAFYPDVFEKLCPLLLNIPVRFTLCVAVTDSAHVKRVEAAVRFNGLNGRLICRVGKNRGRNFGTMLAEFSGDIETHDILLHLHTKRSLYSGREQAEWRDSLYKGLVGSRPLVNGLLNILAEHKKVGLVYPATFKDLPYWAHHWLSNRQNGTALLARLGVEEIPEHYFDFPVGGMFWARVDSLRPLFELRLTYGDFAIEAGQTDGTLAHAIERAIGVLAKSRDYRFVEVDYEQGLLRDGWSDRNLRQYRYQSLDRFKERLGEIDLVSFDIFDTLVVRPTLNPDSIIQYAGHRMNHELADHRFFERRKQAETKARAVKNFEGDVDIHEIYDQFDTGDGWTPALIAKAKTIELELDLAVVQPRPRAHDMIEAARALGLRVIAITDTYLPPDKVAAILAKCGFDGLIDRVYVSNAEQKRKDRGDLWAAVAKAEGADSGRWMHVGDNEHSDIQAACDRGMKFFHVMNPAHLARLEGFDPPPAAGPTFWSSDLVVGPALLRLAGDPFLDGRPFRGHRLSTARDVGYTVFGPIIFAFLAWIVIHPARSQVEKLCFLAREGFMLQKAYEAVRAHCTDLAFPESIYLLTSRRTALGASQAVKFTPDRIVNGGSGFKGRFEDLLLNRVGFVLDDDSIGPWVVRLPQDERPVTAAIKVLKKPLVEHSKRELETYRPYLTSVGLREDGVFGLVDVGYSGTIQKSLQEIVKATFVGFYMATSPQASAVEKSGGFAFGCFSEEAYEADSDAPVMKHSLVMEAFLTAPHGQLNYFGPDGPIMKKNALPSEHLDALNELHEGAIAYCVELMNTYGSDLLFTISVSDQVQETFRMLCNGDLSASSDILDALSVEDEYCGNGNLEPFRRIKENT